MREPRQHRGFLAGLYTTTVLTAPFPFIGRELRLVFGLPLWLWWSVGFTVLLSCLTAWGIMRLWSDDRFE